MQQPFEQYVLVGQLSFAPHTVVPVGHCCMLQPGGSVLGSWPGHRMQVVPPHSVLPHDVTFVQRLQMFGSARFVSLQPGDVDGLIAMSKHCAGFVPGMHSVQHPKQSQPGGVS